jgi:hypothetical protein
MACKQKYGTALEAISGLRVTVFFVAGLAMNLAAAQTWTQTTAPSNYWFALASSADGRTLVAAIGGGGGQGGSAVEIGSFNLTGK